jgi:hypothetical protein
MGDDQPTMRPNRPEDRPTSAHGSGSNWDPETASLPRADQPSGMSPTPGSGAEAAGSNWDAETDPAASDDVERTGEGAHER